MKRIVKIVGGIVLILLILVISAPFLFKGKIIELVKKTANENINATLDFKNADLSLFSSFPNTELTLKDIYIANNAPFEGDTLFKANKIDLKLPFKTLFNSSSEAIKINSFSIDGAKIYVKIDSLGNANYDIAKKTENSEQTETSNSGNSFSFDVNEYSISNSSINYHADNIDFIINDFNHSGQGNLSADETVLKTNSSALITFVLDSTSYFNNTNFKLKADLKLDLANSKYSFLENEALINQLSLIFDGFVKLNEKNKELDINFKTPSSDFKNFLALIPEKYSKNIEGVSTTGNFDIKGSAKGIMDETRIPAFDVTINSENASFKYPSLPKSLKNIHINTQIANKTGNVKDTYVDIEKLAFKIDEDVFNANAKITDLTENMEVKANLDGVVNLGKLEQIYPADAVKGLKGILKAKASTAFDMKSIEQKRYENTKTEGKFDISDFQYTSAELKNPLSVKHTSLEFNPKTVTLNDFDAKIGDSDLNIKGSIENLLGFMFNKENIKGNFNLKSNNFSVNDFMTSEAAAKDSTTVSTPKSEEKLQIPSFLDCTLDVAANTVVYDNINLKNVSGTLIIKDQQAILKSMKTNAFGGNLGFNGLVSTKTETPTFNMKLDIKKVDIAQTFAASDLFKSIAPIANAITGKLNTDVALSGNLNSDFSPNLSSLSGDVFAQLLSSSLKTDSSPLVKKLTENTSFFDAKKLNLDKLKTKLSFKDGKVAVDPFKLKYEDIEIAVGGSHSFDKSVDYNAVFNVPAKYLGKEASSLIAQLNDKEQNEIKVPITANLKGQFNNPAISTDLKSAVKSLSSQIVNNQKDKLVNKGKEELGNVLDNLLNKKKDSTKVDSTKTKKPDAVKDAASNLINDIFGKKKKKN